MTRSIGTIYEDLTSFVNNFDMGRVAATEFTGYKGCSQVVDSALLKEMYDMLLELFSFLEKETTEEVYAPEVMYIFDTQWWSIAGYGITHPLSGQYAEIDDFYYDGYTSGYRRRTFNSHTYKRENWLIDENSLFRKQEGCSLRAIVYDDSLSKMPDNTPKDLYRVEDICDWNSGDFFDPEMIAIETKQELDAWLDVFDSILTKAKALKPYETLEIPTTTAPYRCSDLVNIGISYSNDYWYDEATGDSGDIIKQSIDVWNDWTENGHWYGRTLGGVPKTVIVYSETRTVKQIVDYDPDPPYDPIYEDFTYNTTDPKTGLSFGATADAIHAFAVENIEDTYGAERYYGSGTPQGYMQYYYNASSGNGVDGHEDERYERNFTPTIKFLDDTIVDGMSDIAGSNSTYNIVEYTHNEERLDQWSPIDTEQWESNLLKISENIKTPSLVANRFVTNEAIVEIDYVFPAYGTETLVKYGAIWGYPYSYSAKFIEGVDLDKYTVHLLAPPEEPPA